MQPADVNFLSVMSLGWRRKIYPFYALVLILGLLSADLDMLVDHVPTHAERFMCIHGASFPQHLVGDYGAKVPPCSACLLHKLLAHSLVSAGEVSAPAAQGVKLSALQPINLASSFLRREKSRSPPLG